ncbi:E3 ubiquitin-protein ligase AMFR [Toxocara canis]|uniref:E3 ubiquitin-protein ligase AMFR n=1 Tax=Toxocara canis TaxID=6265 RepID=A0A0B2VA01_TOXCA|nr:E3 ubiquitin-protein ligase AMFR [Toxocara canis]
MLRDRLCSLLLYKVLFLFGVLNSTAVEELVAWIVWFAVLTVFTILQLIAIQKIKYFSASLPSCSLRFRVLAVGVISLCSASTLMFFTFFLFTFLPLSYCLFMFADISKLVFRGAYITCKSALLSQRIDGLLSRRTSVLVSYYLDLAYDVLIDCVEFLHYAHMLLYSQIVLSIACVALSMQLRSFYKSLSTRIARHLTHQRISAHIISHYREATKEELEALSDWCAICWEKMDSARCLPCAHYFHEWCLIGWLEQDSSCPTCRLMLPSSFNDDAFANAPRGPVTHFFYFDGPRIAEWLPSFSFEFTHGGIPRHFPRNERFVGSENSQLSSMAEQVREMFPQVDLNTIWDDLRMSGSMQATIENILEGRVPADQSDVQLDADNNEEDSQPWELADRSAVPSRDLDWNTASTALTSRTVTNTGSRFSSHSQERQTILLKRRTALIERNRRRYIASSRGADLRTTSRDIRSVDSLTEMSRGDAAFFVGKMVWIAPQRDTIHLHIVHLAIQRSGNSSVL